MDTGNQRFSSDNDIKSQAFLGIIVSYLLTQVVFWTVSGLYLIADVTGKPRWMIKYKTQPSKNQPVETSMIKKVAYMAVRNQCLLGFPCTVLLFLLERWRGCDLSLTFPEPMTLLRDLAVCSLVEEIGFYYSHRLLHHPLFYKTIHKIHHEWTAPIAMAAVYAHPVEYIVSNMLPLAMGPIICGSSLITIWVWYCIAVIFTLNQHSGYHLPCYPSNEFHDFHHLTFRENFGVLGLLDWLHGTDIKYRKSKQYQRDTIIFSSTKMVYQ